MGDTSGGKFLQLKLFIMPRCHILRSNVLNPVSSMVNPSLTTLLLSLIHPTVAILNDPALCLSSFPLSCTRLKEPVPTAYPIWGDVFPVPWAEILNAFPTESLFYCA